MALLRCDFSSDVLGVDTSMTVLLPDHGPVQDLPTLYLLHGLSDDDTAWIRWTALERHVAGLGLAVVMPRVERSFYADEVWGRRYWTFVADELPVVARRMFRLSARREDTFVAGLSMGGYGAFKLALRHPDRYAAAASLSGVLDLGARVRAGTPAVDPLMWRRVFGDTPFDGSDNDLFTLLERLDRTAAPALFQWCGTEDALNPGNDRFAAACRRLGVPLTAGSGPGTHEWVHWDAKIREVLAWLPLPSRTGPKTTPPAGE